MELPAEIEFVLNLGKSVSDAPYVSVKPSNYPALTAGFEARDARRLLRMLPPEPDFSVLGGLPADLQRRYLGFLAITQISEVARGGLAAGELARPFLEAIAAGAEGYSFATVFGVEGGPAPAFGPALRPGGERVIGLWAAAEGLSAGLRLPLLEALSRDPVRAGEAVRRLHAELNGPEAAAVREQRRALDEQRQAFDAETEAFLQAEGLDTTQFLAHVERYVERRDALQRLAAAVRAAVSNEADRQQRAARRILRELAAGLPSRSEN